MRVIYALRDPRTGEIRYIGYTKHFRHRMYWHFHDYSTNKQGTFCSTFYWIKELTDIGLLPQSEFLEVLKDDDDWQTAEKKWIKRYRDLGAPLLNLTPGGAGGGRWGWENLTEEERARRSARVSAHMKCIRASATTEEIRERGRKGGIARFAMHGNNPTDSFKFYHRGKPTSEKQKQVASSVNKSRWANYTPEQREVVVANMSAAAKRRHGAGI